MDPIEFHKTLNFYSQAKDSHELVNKVLGGNQKPLSSDLNVARLLTERVEKFFNDNERQLALFDLPALENLQHLVHKEILELDRNSDLAGQCDYLKALEKTIEVSLNLAKNDSDLSILPDVLLSLSDQYSSIGDYIKLALLGRAPSTKIIDDAFATASNEDIADFMQEARQRYESEPLIFNDMIHIFFQHAPAEAQVQFFSSLTENDDHFLTSVISALPSNLTYLDLSGCPCVEDHHLENIGGRLNSLQSLNLTGCNKLTDAAAVAITHLPNLQQLDLTECYGLADGAIVTIANSSNMAELQILILTSCPLSDAAVAAIANSPHMTNLHNLIVDNCIALTDAAVVSIANSPHMAKLKELGVQGCNLTNAAVVAIANSPHMTNLQILLFVGSMLTNAAVVALANSPHINNLQYLNLSFCRPLSNAGAVALAQSPNMANLKDFNLSGCNLLTDEAAVAVAESRYIAKLLNLNFSGCNLMTDHAVAAIAASPQMKTLEVLSFINCPLLTDEAALAILSSPFMTNLLRVDFEGCNLLTDETRKKIAQMLKQNAHRGVEE